MAATAVPKREQLPGTDNEDLAGCEAREDAVARLRRKRKFAQDAVAFISINGLLWLIWLIADRSTDGSIPWPAWISLVWGFFLALDGWRAYGPWPSSLSTPISESEIERELERMQRR